MNTATIQKRLAAWWIEYCKQIDLIEEPDEALEVAVEIIDLHKRGKLAGVAKHDWDWSDAAVTEATYIIENTRNIT
jgi:hypothetical protein